MKIKLSGTTALVIEERAESVQLLRAVLEPFGLRLMTAHSAEEAKSVLGAITPDVIIADPLLRDDNGLAFIHWLRSRKEVADANIPAIAVTSLPDECIRDDAEAAGFTMFFRRPFDPMELVVAVALLTRG
jgi:CheY-like chemotaxis protein